MKKKLHFMCVGVQKAGTSTFHDILQQHPDINLPINKETHFFRDRDKFEKGIDHYFSYYFKDSPTPFWGEIDPEYIYFKDCAEAIFKTFGKIKIIIILRNPVDRAYSHYQMTKSRSLESLDFITAIKNENERLTTHYNKIHFSYISRSLYAEQIERFESFFGKENLKVLLFENLIKNTDATINETMSFLNIPSYNFDYSIKSNVASEPKNKLLQNFIYKPNKLKSAVGKLIPVKKIKDKIMLTLAEKNKKAAPKTALSIDQKQMIYNTYFKNEIDTLESKLNRDLSHWRYE